MQNLDKLQSQLKTGLEPLIVEGNELGYSLLDFWQWSVSDILSNATRGRFAEFIVANLTGLVSYHELSSEISRKHDAV